MNKRRSNNKIGGFTLIETLITLTIAATLGILAIQVITNGLKSKTLIQFQVTEASKIRDATRQLKHDIELAFHPTDIEEKFDKIFKGVKARDQFHKSAIETALDRSAKRNVFDTHFMGGESELSFVTLNIPALNENVIQADFGVVGYKLDSCKKLDENKETTGKCLWRRSNVFVTDDITIGGESVSILDDVTEFKLQYIGPGKPEWVNEWRTQNTDDSATKGKFPFAVKISLTVTKKTKGGEKKFTMQSVATLHFPNNQTKDDNNPNPNPNPGGNGGAGGAGGNGPTI